MFWHIYYHTRWLTRSSLLVSDPDRVLCCRRSPHRSLCWGVARGGTGDPRCWGSGCEVLSWELSCRKGHPHHGTDAEESRTPPASFPLTCRSPLALPWPCRVPPRQRPSHAPRPVPRCGSAEGALRVVTCPQQENPSRRLGEGALLQRVAKCRQSLCGSRDLKSDSIIANKPSNRWCSFAVSSGQDSSPARSPAQAEKQ